MILIETRLSKYKTKMKINIKNKDLKALNLRKNLKDLTPEKHHKDSKQLNTTIL